MAQAAGAVHGPSLNPALVRVRFGNELHMTRVCDAYQAASGKRLHVRIHVVGAVTIS